MQVDDKDIELLNGLEKKNLALSKAEIHAVSKLLAFYNFVVNSPFYDSYVSLRTMMANLNQDLKDDSITLFAGISMSESKEGQMTVDEKTFMNAHKYATETKDYHEQLKYLRANMTPEQITAAEKEVESSMTTARKGLKAQIANGKS